MCQGETVPDVAGSRTRTISSANPTLRSVRREKFPASENSPNERLGNVRLHQSALAPENFTTMPISRFLVRRAFRNRRTNQELRCWLSQRSAPLSWDQQDPR